MAEDGEGELDTLLLTLLSEYDLGPVEGIEAAGGTAGRTWRVTTPRGAYLLRLRGARTSSEAHLAFDHGLRAHLVAGGIPTVEAASTRRGARWLRRQGRAYELYPFVAGRPFDPHSRADLEGAARALAAFHRAARGYAPPPSWTQTVAQYTSLGFSERVSDRMDDPRLQLANLIGVRGLARTEEEARLVERCIARVRALHETYGDEVYRRLAGYIIHGDYTPANVLYRREGEIAGVFDFDWAMRGPRCLDVAYGLCFFAAEPRRIDGADIWSLTEAGRWTVARCAAFVRAYHDAWPLAAAEIEALPHAFCSLWLSKRLEGMAKVDPGQRFRFFARDIERPLLWMDAHWEALRRAAFAPGGDVTFPKAAMGDAHDHDSVE